MKKTLSIAAMSVLLATAANADIMRVEGAVGMWQTEPTGTITYENNTFDIVDNAGFDKSTATYAWIYLKHPVPVIPNVRLEYVQPSYDSTISKDISWGGNTYTAGMTNELSLTEYDAVLYYNLLDNTFWTTVDLGLDVKLINGNYKLSDTTGTLPAVDESFDLAMVLPYMRARVQLPVTNIGIEAIARGISYGNNKVVDAEIKVDYTMDFVPVVQPGFEIGYRYQQITIDGGTVGAGAELDTTFSGIYGGLMVRF